MDDSGLMCCLCQSCELPCEGEDCEYSEKISSKNSRWITSSCREPRCDFEAASDADSASFPRLSMEFPTRTQPTDLSWFLAFLRRFESLQHAVFSVLEVLHLPQDIQLRIPLGPLKSKDSHSLSSSHGDNMRCSLRWDKAGRSTHRVCLYRLKSVENIEKLTKFKTIFQFSSHVDSRNNFKLFSSSFIFLEQWQQHRERLRLETNAANVKLYFIAHF